jgi:hypothetical protein
MLLALALAACRNFAFESDRADGAVPPAHDADVSAHDAAHDATHEPDAESDEEPSILAVEVGLPRLDAVRGELAQVPVSLLRSSRVARDVTISVDGLPAGVSVEPLSIAADESEGTLRFTLANDASVAVLSQVTVRADDGAGTRTAKLALYVRGQPGTIDDSFGHKGVLAISARAVPGYNHAAALRVLDNDRILVAATEWLGTTSNAVVVRVTADGSLDSDFGVDGVYDYAAGHPGSPLATDLAGMTLTRTGRIRLVGEQQGDGQGAFIEQLTSSGKVDADFVAPALSDLHTSRLNDLVQNGEVLPTTLAVGTFVSNPLTRSFDEHMGLHSGGGTYSPVGGFTFVFWDPFQDMFVAGGGCDGKPCLARASRYGDPLEWGVADHRTFDNGELLFAGTIDDEGRYYAVGAGSGWLLARYVPAALSSSGSEEFASRVDDVGPTNDSATAVALSKGSMYVAGALNDVEKSEWRAALGRYSPEGVRDASFADEGLLTFAPALAATAARMGVQTDGRIIVALCNLGGDLLLYRVWD